MFSYLKCLRSLFDMDHSKRRRRLGRNEAAIAHEQLEPRQMLTVSYETLADLGISGVESSNPKDFVFGDTLAYFKASTVATGTEIWRTDGTETGTILLRDFVPGPESPSQSNSDMLTVVGDTAFFRITSPLTRRTDLWRSDGTTTGTAVMTKADGSRLVDPDSITGGEGYIYFTAGAPTERALYRLSSAAGAVPVEVELTDGFAIPFRGNVGVSTTEATYLTSQSQSTTGGVGLLKVHASSSETESMGIFRRVFPYKALGSRLIFTALEQSSPSSAEDRWWITDGTADGTHELNLPANVAWDSLEIGDDGSIIFLAVANDLTWQVWKTDGSENGASLQFSVGNQALRYSPVSDDVATADGRIFFKPFSGAGAGLIWQTDGTLAGTITLPRTTDVTIVDLEGGFADGVVFEGRNQQNVSSLYYVDQSRTVPTNLLPAGMSVSTPIHFGRTMMLASSFTPDAGYELGVATAQAPFDQVDLERGTSSLLPRSFNAASDNVVFDSNRGLVRTNGSTAGTALLNLTAESLIVLPNGRVFATEQPNTRHLLTRAANGSTWIRMEDIAPRDAAFHVDFLTTVGNQLYFLAGLDPDNRSLWVTDGTGSGTRQISGDGQSIGDLTIGSAFGDHSLLFERGPAGRNRELWITDGTSQGTRKLTDLGAPNFSDHITTTFQVLGSRMLVFDPVGISALTDGTLAGTVRLEGFASAMPSGSIRWFGDASGFLYFGVLTRDSAVEFWRTDGTVAGTQRIRVIRDHLQIVDGMSADGAFEGVTAGGLIYFSTSDMKGRADVWVSDGTDGGTRILKSDLISRTDSSGVHDLILYSKFGRLLMLATDETHGRRLWMSDGTDAGTELLVTASGDAPPFMQVLGPDRRWSKSALATMRGAIYYGGITNEFGLEPVKLTSDTIDYAPLLSVSKEADGTALHWNEVFGAESYEIQFIRLSGGEKTTVEVVGDQWKLPSIASDGSYRVWIRGRRADGTIGPWNAEPFDFNLGNRPVIHTAPILTEDRTPTIFWSNPPGTTATEVWINDLETKQRVAYSLLTGTRSRFETMPLNSSRYAAWVRTMGDYGTSEWSLAADMTVLISAPANLTVDVTPGRLMTVQWSPVAGATDYEVVIRGAKSSIPLVSRFGIGPVTSYQIPTPVPGDLYLIAVRARRPGRPFSAWTPVISTLVKEPPKPVIATSVIRWAAIGQAIGYEVNIIDRKTGATIVGTSVTNLEFRHGLTPGLYEIQIRTLYRDGRPSAWASTQFEVFHPPVIVTPVPAATVDGTPVIFWTGQTGADRYEVVIARSGQTAATYRDAEVRATSHRIAVALNPGSYSIWIRSYFADGSRSAWGAGMPLRIGAPPVISLAGRTVLWSPLNGATNYEVIVQRAVAGQYINYLGITDGVSTSVSLAAAPAGTYRASVRAKRYEAGEVYLSEWSSLLQFELT